MKVLFVLSVLLGWLVLLALSRYVANRKVSALVGSAKISGITFDPVTQPWLTRCFGTPRWDTSGFACDQKNASVRDIEDMLRERN